MASKQNNKSTRPTLEQVKQATTEAAQSGRSASILRARATSMAEIGGFVGKGSTANPEWPTWGDYARSLGVSPARMTGYRRMGQALALGIDPENTANGDAGLWSLLSLHSGDKAIGEALADPKATATKVRKAIKAHAGSKARTKASGAKSADKRTKATDKGVTMPRNVPGLVTLLEQVTANLASAKVGPADYKRIAQVVGALEQIRPTAERPTAKATARKSA